MVYRDYWALSHWVRHYSALVGRENLFIVAHGKDKQIEAIASGASVITIPRDAMDGFDVVRGRVLNGLQSSLSNVYDWVLRTDVDELIVIDPSRFGSIDEVLASCDAPALFALGCDLVEDDPGHSAVFTGHYSKAFAVAGDTRLYRHGVRLRKKLLKHFKYVMPVGVYLAHIKYANKHELACSNEHRIAVASAEGSGLPGRAWQEAHRDAERMFRKVGKMPWVAWDEASQTAYEALSIEPIYEEQRGVLRCRSIRFNEKAEPPEWFPNLD